MTENFTTFLRLMCIVYLVVFVPRFISFNNEKVQDSAYVPPQNQLGIENFISNNKQVNRYKNKKLALFVDQLSYDQQANRTIDLLMRAGCDIKKIALLDREAFQSDNVALDIQSRVPCYRLSDHTFWEQNQDFLCDVDVVCLDLSCSGLRFDLSTSVMTDALKCAHMFNKKVVIFDRFNPLGACIEGPGSIPLRHGMTLGELALYYNQHLMDNELDLEVIPLKGWNRKKPLEGFVHGQDYDSIIEDGLMQMFAHVEPVQIRKNDENKQALLFVKQAHLSTWEFEYLNKLCDQCGFATNQCSYRDEQGMSNCKAMELYKKDDVPDPSAFNTFLTLTRFLKNRKGIKLQFSPHFDQYVGSSELRCFLQDRLSLSRLKKSINKKVEQFYKKSQNCFLYKPLPNTSQVTVVKN